MDGEVDALVGHGLLPPVLGDVCVPVGAVWTPVRSGGFGLIVGPDGRLPTEDPVFPYEPLGCVLPAEPWESVFVGDVLPELCFPFPVDDVELG